MKKNLFLTFLLLLAVTWTMGQKDPTQDASKMKKASVTTDIVDVTPFMNSNNDDFSEKMQIIALEQKKAFAKEEFSQKQSENFTPSTSEQQKSFSNGKGEVTIGTGTLTNLQLPINPYYGFSYSQTIYYQTDIAQQGNITKIYYNWNGGAAGTNCKDWVVYMGHTAKTAFSGTTDWIPVAQLTQVFSGVVTLTTTAGWVEITLNTPFAYNNTSNLVIAVDENTAGYGGSAENFYGTSFGANRGIVHRSDATNANPAAPPTASAVVAGFANVKLFVEPPAAYAFNVTSPTGVAVNAGASYDYSVTISNTGTNADNFTPTMDPGGVWTYGLYANDGTTPLTVPMNIAGASSASFKVKVTVAADAGMGVTDTKNFTVTSAEGGKAVKTFSITTTAIGNITTFPYAESFDGVTFAPTGWTNIQTAGTGTTNFWTRVTSGLNPTCSPQSGAAMAKFASYDYATGTNAELSTPNLNIPAENYLVSFWMYRDDAYLSSVDQVKVYINTTNTSVGATLLGTINRNRALDPVVAANGWYNYKFFLPEGLAGQTRRIIFEAVGKYGNNIYFDNVTVREKVVPLAPTDLTFTAVSQTGMTVNWKDGSTNETGFRVYISTDGQTYTQQGSDVSSTTVAATGGDYNLVLTGLVPGTTYYYKVVALGDFESEALLGDQATSDPGVITSIQTGNWNDVATWSTGVIPTATDNVTIAPEHTITVNAAGTFNILNLEGNLVFQGFTLAGGEVNVMTSGTVSIETGTIGTLSVTRNVTNEGNMDFFVDGTIYGKLMFTGTAAQLFTNTGTVQLGNVEVSKTARANMVEINLGENFTIKDGATGFLTLTAGTLKLSGEATVSNNVFLTASYSIGATGGFWLNAPNFTVLAQNGQPLNNGLLRLSAGTYNVGTLLNDAMGAGAGAVFTFEGGVMNLASRLQTTSAVTFTMTGGVINVNLVGNNAATASFGLTSTLNTINISGGVINLVQRSTNASPLDYSLSGTSTITGGLLNIGTEATATNFDFRITGRTPNLAIDNTVNAKSALITAQTNVFGDITLPVGTVLNAQTFNLVIWGSVNDFGHVYNDGLITSNSAAGVLYFANTTGKQIISGTGSIGTTTQPIFAIAVQNPMGIEFDGVSVVTNRFNAFYGMVEGFDNVTLGNGGTSTPIVQRGVASNTYPAGSFDGVPTFNPGTSYSILYTNSTVPYATGSEMPELLNGTLTMNSNVDVTLSSTAEVGILSFAATNVGKLITTADAPLTVVGTTVASVVNNAGNTGYVQGPLARVFPASLTGTSTYAFPIGKGSFNQLEIVNPKTTADGTVTILAEVFDLNPGGTTGAGILEGSLQDRFWFVDAVEGAENATSTQIKVNQAAPALAASAGLARSETVDGEYVVVSNAAPAANAITSSELTELGFFGLVTKLFYDVNFLVTDGTNPIDGATIAISGQANILTDVNGTATKNLAYGNYTYSISKAGFYTYSGSFLADENLTTIEVELEGVYVVEFHALDQAAANLGGVQIVVTGSPTVYGEEVVINQTLTTAGTGLISYSLPSGEYSYVATKADYYEATGTFTVESAPVSEQIDMQIYPLVTITVKDGDEVAVSGATVTITGYTPLTTDGTGIATKRLAIGEYTAEAYKIGYYSTPFDIDVVDNTDFGLVVTLNVAPPTFEYTADWTNGANFGRGLASLYTKTTTFEITNIGTGDLTVDMADFSITGDDVFSFGADYTGVVHTLATNAKATFAVKFTPVVGGTYTAELTYENNGEPVVVTLTGSSYDPNAAPFVETFESGSFENNNWFTVNGSQANKWYVGTSAGDTENLSAIISNDNGVTNAYTNNSASVTHLYADFAIPSGDVLGDVVLAFDWKALAESGDWDHIKVYSILPTEVPVAGTQLIAGNQIGARYNQSGSWTKANIDIPVAQFGTTRRIVFTWKNDGSLGDNPPASIDNVELLETNNIVSVGSLENYSVAYGTTLSNLGLPQNVTVELDGEYYGSTTVGLELTWNAGSPIYNKDVAGEYVFTGTPVLVPGILNPTALKAGVTVTVEKGNPVVTTWPVAGMEVVYGATLAEVGLDITEADVDVPGTFTFVDENEVPEVIEGGYIAAVVFTPDDTDNYNEVEGSVLVTVTPLDITFEGAMALDKVYDGTADADVVGGSLVGVLAADLENVMVDAGATIWGQFVDAEGDVTVVVGTNINVVTPTLTISGSAAHNYNLILPDYLTADITAKELTVINAVAQNKVYDGDEFAVITSAQLEGVVPGDGVVLEDATEGTFEQSTVGTDLEVTVNMSISGDDAGNYYLTQPDYLAADITPKSLYVINAVALDKIYDRTNVAEIVGAELDGVVGEDEVLLENHEAGTFPQFTVGEDLDVTTSMSISGVDAFNYTLVQPDYLTADIDKFAISIIADDQIKKSGTVFTFEGDEFTVEPATIDPDAVTSVTLTSDGAAADALANEDPGYEIVVSNAVGEGLDNYEITYVSGNMIVTDKIILTLPDLTVADKVYDATRTATVTTWGDLAGDFDPENSDVDYDVTAAVAEFATAGAGLNKTVSITGVVLTGADAAIYKLATLTPTADIFKKDLSITAQNKTKVYGNADPALTVVYDGFVAGQTIANLAGALVVSREAGENVGTYAITPSGFTSANYEIDYVTGEFAITERPITVTAHAKTKVYGQDDPALTYAITSGTLATGDAITGALEREVGEDVGSYEILSGTLTITKGAVDVESNYDATFVSDYLTITPKALTVANAVAQSKVYDKTTAAVITGAQLVGVVTGDNVTLENGNVGTFAQATVGNNIPVSINMSISGDVDNYTFNQPTGLTANITAKPLAVINAVAEDKLYDGTTAAVITGAALDAVITGDVVVLDNATVGTFAQSTVGTNIAVTTAMAISGADVANYSLTGQPAGLLADISAVELTIGGTFTASNKLYDGTVAAVINPAGLTLNGVVAGQTVTLTNVVAEFASPNVGTGITVSIVSAQLAGATASNYTLSLVGAPTATANIYNEFALTLVANPVAGGTITGTAGNYQPDTQINLNATPAAGYSFVNWTNGATVVSTVAQFVFTMPAEAVTLTANFELIPVYSVTFAVVDGQAGPLEGATIAINGQNLTTDAQGIAVINGLMDGTYPYVVSKAEYVNASGNAVVAGSNLPVGVVLNDVIVAPFNVAAAVINGNSALVNWNTVYNYTDDIESYDNFITSGIGEYTLVDVDGSATYSISGATFPNQGYVGSYIVFNPSAVTPALTSEQWQPHGGSKYLACFAGTSAINNDWLISPQMPAAPGMVLSFWAKSVVSTYGLERMKVGVSTTGTAPANFTFITPAPYVQVPTTWTQYTYDLSAYAGQQVYLAINCVSNDAYTLMIDDIFVGTTKTPENKGFLGYTLYLNDAVQATGLTSTEYTITELPVGEHIIGVQSVYSSGSSAIIYADPITVYPSDFAVSFTVTSGGAPISGAVVTVNSQEITTGADGIATLNLPNGTYPYIVSKLGYNNATGSVVVNNAAVNQPVSMTLAPFATTFAVTSAGAPLAGVSIIVNGTTILTTNAQGTVIGNFVNGSYTFVAAKAGYDNYNGEFVVNNATQTISINMVVGIDGVAEHYVRLYPNPVSDVLNIERNSSEEVVVELYNNSGALINSFKTENVTTTFDVSTLGSGSYYIRVIGTNSTTIHRFIKQ